MNGRDLTLGLVAGLAVGAALGRRGSRARWRGQTSGPVHTVAHHFGRSASLRPGFGRGIHWGTEWSALDRWSMTGKPPGQLVTAQIQLDRPLWTGEVCQWLDPGCVLWNLTDDLGVMRRLAEDGGVRWHDDFDLEEAREALDRLGRPEAALQVWQELATRSDLATLPETARAIEQLNARYPHWRTQSDSPAPAPLPAGPDQ